MVVSLDMKMLRDIAEVRAEMEAFSADARFSRIERNEERNDAIA